MKEQPASQRRLPVIRQALATLELPVERIFTEARAQPEQWSSSDTAQTVMVRVWRGAIAHTGDDVLPLRTGTCVPFGAFEVVDYLAAACATLGESMVQLARYFDVISPLTRWKVDAEPSPKRVWLHSMHETPDQRNYFTQFTLGVTITRFRNAATTPVACVRAQLALPVPTDDSAYRTLLAGEVSFGHKRTLLELSDAVWTAPFVARAAGLQQVLQRHLDEVLADSGVDAPLSRARLAVRKALPQGAPRLQDIAAGIAMSERTLQRRLREAGTSFQTLLDDERRQAALQHVRNPRLSSGDIAYLVGYSESSVFVRAFKRWTGLSPGAFRANAGSANVVNDAGGKGPSK